MSAIEWTDQTWNPVAGCRRISPGCKNCYAIKEARRKDGSRGGGFAKYAGTTHHANGRLDWSGRFNFDASSFKKVEMRHKPTIYFVNSMSDLFGEGVTDDQIKAIFEVMNNNLHHTFQILTTRPNRAANLAVSLNWTPNIWMGTSIEEDKYVPSRIRDLRKIPAALRFVSAEPLLGPLPSLNPADIHWLIVGGESGVSRDLIRPMDIDWVRDLRDRCAIAATPFFFKQWGNWDEHKVWHRSKKETGHMLDGKEHFEMPEIVRLAMARVTPPPRPAKPRFTLTNSPVRDRAYYRAAILTNLQNGPLTPLALRQMAGALDRQSANTHAWALVDLQKTGEIKKRSDGRYAILMRVYGWAA